MRAYAVGQFMKPWRVVRHSLFISGLSLTIATSAIVAGTLVQRDHTPSFPKVSASTAQRGESTSLGVLARFIKASGSDSEARAASADPTPAVVAAAGPAVEATESSAAEPGEQSETRVTSALTRVAPTIAERPADQGELIVTSARFKVRSTPTVSEAATRAQTAAAALADLQPGDRLTVPVTFYYCEDSTGGQRRGDGGGFCGAMRDGTTVYPGAAACEYQYLGQRFRIEGDPTGRVYVCADTGSGIRGQHRDIWFMNSGEGWAWQQVVGRSAVIQVLP